MISVNAGEWNREREGHTPKKNLGKWLKNHFQLNKKVKSNLLPPMILYKKPQNDQTHLSNSPHAENEYKKKDHLTSY